MVLNPVLLREEMWHNLANVGSAFDYKSESRNFVSCLLFIKQSVTERVVTVKLLM